MAGKLLKTLNLQETCQTDNFGLSHWVGRASILKRVRGRQMKKFLALAAVLFLTACADRLDSPGIGFINGETVDVNLVMELEGLADFQGHRLFVNGEDLGLLRPDSETGSRWATAVTEYHSLSTKYGDFDLTETLNNSLGGARLTLQLTLDGKPAATILREV